MYEPEHMRTWRDDGFRLELYDSHTVQPGTGRHVVEYELFDEQFDDKQPVIGRMKITVPTSEAIDSDGVVAACLNWQDDDFPEPTGRLRQWLETGRLDRLNEIRDWMSDPDAGQQYWQDYRTKNPDE